MFGNGRERCGVLYVFSVELRKVEPFAFLNAGKPPLGFSGPVGVANIIDRRPIRTNFSVEIMCNIILTIDPQTHAILISHLSYLAPRYMEGLWWVQGVGVELGSPNDLFARH